MKGHDMHELWKPVKYPSVPKDVKHYEVSNRGRVRRGSMIEPLTMEENGDVTVILISLNGDYVGPSSTPPAKYVVADLLRDALAPEPKVFGVGNDVRVFDTPWNRMLNKDRCHPRFPQHRLVSFQGLNGERMTYEVIS
jgi:hypothetical protein